MTAGRARLLVTEDAPAYGVLAALRALRRHGYEPWLAMTARGGYGARSRAPRGKVLVPDPAVDPDAYVGAVADAASRLDAAAVLPGTEVGLRALAGRQSAFADGTVVGADDPDVVARATDKLALDALAAAAGFRTPPTCTVTRATAEDADVAFPAVVKTPQTMTDAGGGRLRSVGVRRVESAEELRHAVAELPGDRWLVQPVVQGDLVALVGVAWRGELVCVAQQVAERIFPPGLGISAAARTVALDPELATGAARLVEGIGWSGIFQLQLLRDGDAHHLIDLNPRMYGSLALVIAAGLDLPSIWADLLLGRPVSPGGYRVGVRFRSEERDAGALAAALVSGDWRVAARGALPRRDTVHAVFSWRDPLPILRSVGQVGKGVRALRG